MKIIKVCPLTRFVCVGGGGQAEPEHLVPASTPPLPQADGGGHRYRTVRPRARQQGGQGSRFQLRQEAGTSGMFLNVSFYHKLQLSIKRRRSGRKYCLFLNNKQVS